MCKHILLAITVSTKNSDAKMKITLIQPIRDALQSRYFSRYNLVVKYCHLFQLDTVVIFRVQRPRINGFGCHFPQLTTFN